LENIKNSQFYERHLFLVSYIKLYYCIKTNLKIKRKAFLALELVEDLKEHFLHTHIKSTKQQGTCLHCDVTLKLRIQYSYESHKEQD